MEETSVSKVLFGLKRNHMAGYFAKNKAEVFQLIEQFIQRRTTIGCGDSVTLEQLGIFDYLRTHDFIFYDKFDKQLSSELKREIYIKNFSADTFITGTNAITHNGEIFNIDGNGSRVAPIIYGPDQVIIVVGVNKIVSTIDEAIRRTRQIAAPMDAKRLGKNTPCAKLGRCVDCHHTDRICNDFVLITGQFNKNRIKVIIVDEILGY